MSLAYVLARVFGYDHEPPQLPAPAAMPIHASATNPPKNPKLRLHVRSLSEGTTLVQIDGHHRSLTNVRGLVGPMMALTNDERLHHIILDISNVESLTAGMLSLLVSVQQRLRCQGRQFMLSGVSPACISLLRIAEVRIAYTSRRIRARNSSDTDTWPSSHERLREMRSSASERTVSA